MQNLLMIAAGGALGALCRYGLSESVANWAHTKWPTLPFAWGILSCNLLGCFLIGLLFHLIAKTGPIPHDIRFFATIGFLGAFTTFSTFSLECVDYLRDAAYLKLGLYILASNVGGIALAMVGLKLGHLLTHAR